MSDSAAQLFLTTNEGRLVRDVRALLQSTRSSHLVFFVHGFENTVANALGNYAPYLQSFLHDKRYRACGVFWDSTPSPPYLNYPKALGRALIAARSLARAFDAELHRTPLKQLSFIGHSLGCRLIVECIHTMRTTSRDSPLKRFVLMAPAIPLDLAQDEKHYRPELCLKKRIVHYSFRDFVLRGPFRLGQGAARAMGIERPSCGIALGASEPPSPFCETPKQTAIGHGAYWSDAGVYNHTMSEFDVAHERAMAQHKEPDSTPQQHTAATRDIPSRTIPAR